MNQEVSNTSVPPSGENRFITPGQQGCFKDKRLINKSKTTQKDSLLQHIFFYHPNAFRNTKEVKLRFNPILYFVASQC